MIDRIAEMLASCSSSKPLFPPTDLYNEGWMLRLILDWSARHGDDMVDHPLGVPAGCRWYSEALLESQFKPREKLDRLGEGYTHADGVVGHFEIGGNGQGDLVLAPDATHLVVIEAKMFSRLSKRTTHARYFDQAARNVACVAHALSSAAQTPPERFAALGFAVVIPECHPRREEFKELLDKDGIQKKVQRRVGEYGGKKREWFDEWFAPTLRRIDIRLVTWEEILLDLRRADEPAGDALSEFYSACLRHNREQKT
jgi:hypothetical protein